MSRWRCAAAAWLVVAAAAGAAEPQRGCRAPEAAPAWSEAGSGLSTRADGARIAAREGRRADAETQLAALETEVAALGDPTERARLRIHLARTWVVLDRPRRAAELLLQAAEDARDRDLRLLSYAQGHLAERYEAAGRLEDATALARRALFAAQRAEAPDAAHRWQWLLARVHEARGRGEPALEAYRAAVATLRRAPALVGPETRALYLALADLLLQRAAAAADAQPLLAEARSTLEDLKAGELRDYFRDPCLDAQRKAKPDTVPGALVVYPVPLPDRLALIVGREGRLSLRTVDVARERLVETARELRHKVEKRTTREYLRPSAAMYEWLVRPLDLTGVDTLVFVPDAVTRALPFAALYDAEAGEFLVEKVPVAITPGLTLTEPRPLDARSARMLVAGVSEGVQGYAPLEGVRREVDALHQRFEGRQLLDEDFRAERFEAAVREQIFDVVHVASHGEFFADGSESFLLTWDGRIPMDDLGEVVGETRFRERGVELLTLSACRTAVGDERAALGLAGVALRAGARSAIATLWSVNDVASSELMIAFYEQLRERRVSRAAALRAAQLQVLSQRAHRHPAYWAPFVLINSWL